MSHSYILGVVIVATSAINAEPSAIITEQAHPSNPSAPLRISLYNLFAFTLSFSHGNLDSIAPECHPKDSMLL